MSQVLKRIRKQPKGPGSQWTWKLEPGDRVIFDGNLVVDIMESRGRNKRDAGELTYRCVRKPYKDAKPVKIDGIWYWKWER